MNYRIMNKQVFEQAQVRSVSDVVFMEEELANGMKLAISKKDPTLTLFLVEIDGQKKFDVRWDDSSEIFNGWYSAWDNFLWCLSVVDTQSVQNQEE
ncbi:hypothetical protein MHB44_00700 [Lysinibacillus sp. FSL H8-0500]|uniref:hypothetical protein n=1 Tax=Lysinibacillus sp. FSL H8-0500 TaxID=2921393 RepID=UPI0031016AA0